MRIYQYNLVREEQGGCVHISSNAAKGKKNTFVFFMGLKLLCRCSYCWKQPGSVVIDKTEKREGADSSSGRKMTGVGYRLQSPGSCILYS